MVREQLHGKRDWQNLRRTESRRAQVQFSFSWRSTQLRSRNHSLPAVLFTHSSCSFIHRSCSLLFFLVSTLSFTVQVCTPLLSNFRTRFFVSSSSLSPFEEQEFLPSSSVTVRNSQAPSLFDSCLPVAKTTSSCSEWVSHFCCCSKEPVEKRINWRDNSGNKSIRLLPQIILRMIHSLSFDHEFNAPSMWFSRQYMI